MVKRLLEATASDIAAMNASDLSTAIRRSEGRTLAVEVMCAAEPPVDGISGGELAAAMGADIVALDQYDPLAPYIAGAAPELLGDRPLAGYSAMLGRPVGINLIVTDDAHVGTLGGRRFTVHSASRAVEQGADVIFLYTRPQQGGTAELQVDAARRFSSAFAERTLLIGVPTFSQPAPRTAAALAQLRAQVLTLIEHGCGGVAFPMPGSKQGWMVDAAAALIDAVQTAEALAWLFVTGSVEGAPSTVMSDLALLAKQLGADVVRLDEAGLSGMPPPENIFAFSLALRGARHTYRRIAASLRR